MNAEAIRNEIARLKAQMSDWNIEGRLDADTEADMKAEIADLYDDLSDIEHAAVRRCHRRYPRRTRLVGGER